MTRMSRYPSDAALTQAEHAPACRLGDGDCTCPNPYQPEGKTHE